jgi:hypothetical protein
MSQTKTYESLFREVTSETGRRLVKIAQFGRIIDDATARLCPLR